MVFNQLSAQGASNGAFLSSNTGANSYISAPAPFTMSGGGGRKNTGNQYIAQQSMSVRGNVGTGPNFTTSNMHNNRLMNTNTNSSGVTNMVNIINRGGGGGGNRRTGGGGDQLPNGSGIGRMTIRDIATTSGASDTTLAALSRYDDEQGADGPRRFYAGYGSAAHGTATGISDASAAVSNSVFRTNALLNNNVLSRVNSDVAGQMNGKARDARSLPQAQVQRAIDVAVAKSKFGSAREIDRAKIINNPTDQRVNSDWKPWN